MTDDKTIAQGEETLVEFYIEDNQVYCVSCGSNRNYLIYLFKKKDMIIGYCYCPFCTNAGILIIQYKGKTLVGKPKRPNVKKMLKKLKYLG